MRAIPIYQIDAFTTTAFSGNPAAVCPLDQWLEDELMQKIASENNLSETVFLVKKDEQNWEIRWFTPTVEVRLCGHATLASAIVLKEFYEPELEEFYFHSHLSGKHRVTVLDGLISLYFPQDEVLPTPLPGLAQALGIEPNEIYKGSTDALATFRNQEEIEKLDPNMEKLKALNVRGIIVSAPGEDVDFVSRFFGPGSGILEDPVTGSAHTTLTPFWSARLEKKVLSAKQLSKRGGELECEMLEEKVRISGRGVLVLKGEMYV